MFVILNKLMINFLIFKNTCYILLQDLEFLTWLFLEKVILMKVISSCSLNDILKNAYVVSIFFLWTKTIEVFGILGIDYLRWINSLFHIYV